MAQLYIHIPFCKSRCAYCAFYSTTCLQQAPRYVQALLSEMRLRGTAHLETIYLGGGTPSTLPAPLLERLFDAIYNMYSVDADAEVTIECNPDDVTPAFACLIASLPVNRVSMGVQTFDPQLLRLLNRRHTADKVCAAVSCLRQAGIENISIDLIYGLPGQTLERWNEDINQALALAPEHLSAYALTYEPGTPLHRLLEAGRISPADDELQRTMYYTLKDGLEAHGYEHYEISNFARCATPAPSVSPFRSRHNSGYWQQKPYIGLGAAAHSYDGNRRRQWNVDHLFTYMQGVERGKPVVDGEYLDDTTRYNELVMTALRTNHGLNLDRLAPALRRYCMTQAQRYVDTGLLSLLPNPQRLVITRQGLFVSNMIMSQLMYE